MSERRIIEMDPRGIPATAELRLAGWLWNLSVSKSQVPSVIEYISNQRRHHSEQTFEDEYVTLLNLHGIDYDEKYLFD